MKAPFYYVAYVYFKPFRSHFCIHFSHPTKNDKRCSYFKHLPMAILLTHPNFVNTMGGYRYTIKYVYR